MPNTVPFKGSQISSGIVPNLTAAQWLTMNDYVLPMGVTAKESDTGKTKVGDGATAYSSLGYTAGGQVGSTLTTTPVSSVVINEYGDGRDMTTVLTLTNFIVGALAGAGAALGLGNIVVAFPAGAHLELVYYQNLSLTAAGTAVTTLTGLGSVIASGAIAVLSGTATFQNRLVGQSLSTAAAGGTAAAALLGATAGIGTGISLNAAASIKNVFVNSSGTWNADNTGNLTATGTISFKWTKMS